MDESVSVGLAALGATKQERVEFDPLGFAALDFDWIEPFAATGRGDPTLGEADPALHRHEHRCRRGDPAGGGPDDRLVEEFHAPPMAMDRPGAQTGLASTFSRRYSRSFFLGSSLNPSFRHRIGSASCIARHCL